VRGARPPSSHFPTFLSAPGPSLLCALVLRFDGARSRLALSSSFFRQTHPHVLFLIIADSGGHGRPFFLPSFEGSLTGAAYGVCSDGTALPPRPPTFFPGDLRPRRPRIFVARSQGFLPHLRGVSLPKRGFPVMGTVMPRGHCRFRRTVPLSEARLLFDRILFFPLFAIPAR